MITPQWILTSLSRMDSQHIRIIQCKLEIITEVIILETVGH